MKAKDRYTLNKVEERERERLDTVRVKGHMKIKRQAQPE